MALKNDRFTMPRIGKHEHDLTKDWYVFFQFKFKGKTYKIKRREGVNKIKDLQSRVVAIENLLNEIIEDLKHGWNPKLDPKREHHYFEQVVKQPNTYKIRAKPKISKEGILQKLRNNKGH